MKLTVILFMAVVLFACGSGGSGGGSGDADGGGDVQGPDAVADVAVIDAPDAAVEATDVTDTPDVPIIPVECPNLPNSFHDAIIVKNAGEKKLSDCITKKGCHETMVCSHRGVHDLDHPENSLPAVIKAMELGVDFVEIDIRETADDVLVLMHDSTLDWTTDGTGPVGDFTLEQLRQLTLKEPSTKALFQGVTVPTLEEVFAVTKGKVILDLDMKTNRMDLIAAFFKKFDGYEYMIARKGGTSALKELRALDADIVIMADFYELDDLDALMADIQPGLVQVNYDYEKDVIDMLHDKGIKAWDNALGAIDLFLAASCSPIPLQSYLDKGIDVIQSDYPHFVCPLLKGYTETE